MGKKYIAGVSFADNAAQVAVLELRHDHVAVVHLEEYKNGMNDSVWFLESLREKKAKIFKKVSKVSIALDCAAVVLHSFPMDTSLNHAEQREQVKWELSTLAQDVQPDDQINDVHVLRTHTQDGVAEMFVVSARRSYLQQIHQALHERKYELHLVDTNHFAGQYALAVNYPEAKEKPFVLASIGEQRIDMGTLHNGKLIAYRYIVESLPEEKAKQLATFVREASVEALYVFGTGCSFSVMKGVQDLVDVKITKANPFRRVPIASSLRDTGLILGQEHKFVACVGVALRKE